MPALAEVRGSLLVVTTIGDVDLDDVSRAVADALATRRGRGDVSLLMDSRSSLTYPSPDAVRARVEWVVSLRAHGVGSRVAVVVPADSFRAKLAQQAADLLAEHGGELRVFATVEEAAAWLTGDAPRRGAGADPPAVA
jgi:hypothetical protein